VVEWLSDHFATAPRAHWTEVLAHAGVPCGPVRELHEVVADPALGARGMIRDAALADGTSTRLFAQPWRVDGERPPLRLAPPRLGEHTAAFLARFGG